MCSQPIKRDRQMRLRKSADIYGYFECIQKNKINLILDCEKCDYKTFHQNTFLTVFEYDETFLTLFTWIFKCQKWSKIHIKSMANTRMSKMHMKWAMKLFSHFTHAYLNVKNGWKCIWKLWQNFSHTLHMHFQMSKMVENAYENYNKTFLTLYTCILKCRKCIWNVWRNFSHTFHMHFQLS